MRQYKVCTLLFNILFLFRYRYLFVFVIFSLSFLMLHRPIHFSSVFLLLERLSLVIFLFASGESNNKFCQSLLIDEESDGHNSEAR